MRTEQIFPRDYANRPFGRKGVRAAVADAPPGLAGDVKLFATTFAAGFLFMSVYLA